MRRTEKESKSDENSEKFKQLACGTTITASIKHISSITATAKHKLYSLIKYCSQPTVLITFIYNCQYFLLLFVIAFKQSDILTFVNRLNTEESVIPYEYHHFDFCPIHEENSPVENLGQVVFGERIRPGPFKIKFLKDVKCQQVCGYLPSLS